MSEQSRKYLVSVAVIGDMDSLNRIIKNLYEDFSLVFYKTLLKSMIDKEDLKIDYVKQNECEFNEEINKYAGYFLISSTIQTKVPQKIIDKLIDDEYTTNNFVRRWGRNKITLMIGMKTLSFTEEQYRDVSGLQVK